MDSAVVIKAIRLARGCSVCWAVSAAGGAQQVRVARGRHWPRGAVLLPLPTAAKMAEQKHDFAQDRTGDVLRVKQMP